MSWAVGYDEKWKRDINQPYGGDDGCGLYFCCEHRRFVCDHDDHFAKPDHPDWIKHKLTDPSWEEWRQTNIVEVEQMRKISCT